jgi:hypothetical protein
MLIFFIVVLVISALGSGIRGTTLVDQGKIRTTLRGLPCQRLKADLLI